MGATTTLQEAKQYLVHRLRQVSEEILPGWYPIFRFETKGSEYRMLGGNIAMSMDTHFLLRAVKRGMKTFKLRINENFLRDNIENLHAIDMEDLFVHELEHIHDSFPVALQLNKLASRWRMGRAELIRQGAPQKVLNQQWQSVHSQAKAIPPDDWHSVERYRQAVKERTGSVVASLPIQARASELAFVGRGEALAPITARYLYRCKFCGFVGAYTPDNYNPVRRRTTSGGKTMHLPLIGEGVRCQNCGRFMPADTRSIKLTPRERAELHGLARAHNALPYENLAKPGLPFNYPLYKNKEIHMGKIPGNKLLKVIPRVKSIL